jgi:hypothetical protein
MKQIKTFGGKQTSPTFSDLFFMCSIKPVSYKLQSFGMRHHVIWEIFFNVSEGSAASICNVPDKMSIRYLSRG